MLLSLQAQNQENSWEPGHYESLKTHNQENSYTVVSRGKTNFGGS